MIEAHEVEALFDLVLEKINNLEAIGGVGKIPDAEFAQLSLDIIKTSNRLIDMMKQFRVEHNLPPETETIEMIREQAAIIERRALKLRGAIQ